MLGPGLVFISSVLVKIMLVSSNYNRSVMKISCQDNLFSDVLYEMEGGRRSYIIDKNVRICTAESKMSVVHPLFIGCGGEFRYGREVQQLALHHRGVQEHGGEEHLLGEGGLVMDGEGVLHKPLKHKECKETTFQTIFT